MAEFKTQYDNPLQTTGIKVIEPTPIDDRLIVISEDALKEVFIAPLTAAEQNYIATLYDGLIVLTGDSKKQYIWAESTYGLLDISYTYPDYAQDIAGQDYGGKAFNFVLFDKVAKVVVNYVAGDDGLDIAAGLLPYHIVKSMTQATCTMKSDTSAFEEIEHPDHIVFANSKITIILDPKPNIGEQFRITIY